MSTSTKVSVCDADVSRRNSQYEMAHATSDILDAYRADLEQAQTATFSTDDAAWIALGTLLQRAAAMRPDDRFKYLLPALAAIPSAVTASATAVALERHRERGDLPKLVFEAAREAATTAEEHGAFAVAMLLLDQARSLIQPRDSDRHGRLLYLQARVLRKVGDLSAADRLLQELAALATASESSALSAWAYLGFAVNARIRGNYPRAREAFQAALKQCQDLPECLEIRSHAQHGLLIACAAAGEYETALAHGVAALHAAVDPAQAAEIRVNLAAIHFDMGDFPAALSGYLEALCAKPALRIYVSALGGAALAAAHSGHARAVIELVSRGAALLLRTNPAHELADMARELAEASWYIGDTDRFEQLRAEAAVRARSGGYFEILHRLDTFDESANKPGIPAAARVVDDANVDHDAVGEDRDLLLHAAVNSALPD
jgi:tetratricopeptide (TPR) repeat protein